MAVLHREPTSKRHPPKPPDLKQQPHRIISGQSFFGSWRATTSFEFVPTRIASVVELDGQAFS